MLPLLLQQNVSQAKPILTDQQDLIGAGLSEVLDVVLPTFGATVALDLTQGGFFRVTVTGAGAFTISNPSGIATIPTGTQITIMLRNASGGVMGAITMGALFKGAPTAPANGNSRSFTYTFDGTNWVLTSASPADVPN